MNPLDPQMLRKKAVREVNQDGLVDLIIGILLLVISLYFYLEITYQTNVIMLLILPGIILGPIFMNLRKKFTYPRTGYVNLKTKKNRITRYILLLFVTFLGILVFYLFFRSSTEDIDRILPYFDYLPLMIGIILLICYLNYAVNYKLKRYYILSFVAVASIIYSQLITDRKIISLIIMLFIQAVFFLPIGLYTFLKFLKENPLSPDEETLDPYQGSTLKNLKKALTVIYSDGWQEIFTGCFMLVWIIIMLLPGLNNYWLYATLIFNPLVMSFILYRIRVKRSFLLTMELTDDRIDLLSFASFFCFLFIFSLGVFAILSLRSTYEFRFYIIFLPFVLALLTGFYYLVNAVRYNITRFNFYTLVFFLLGLAAFLVIRSPLGQLISILGVTGVLLLIKGFRHRIRAS